MKPNTFIPPIHWDDATFLRMVEPYCDTELERHMFARLSRVSAFETWFNEGDYETYPHDDLIATCAELEEKVQELDEQLRRANEAHDALVEKLDQVEDDANDLDRKLTIAHNRNAELENENFTLTARVKELEKQLGV